MPKDAYETWLEQEKEAYDVLMGESVSPQDYGKYFLEWQKCMYSLEKYQQFKKENKA